MPAFNPDRLDLARRRRGFSHSELADAANISLRALTAYERREYAPSPEHVAGFAEALGFPAEFFIGPTLDEPPVEGTSFRALTSLTAKQREQALAAGALALALSDWIDTKFRLPAPSVPKLQGLDAETAAAVVRREWGLGERPIRNLVHRLEAHGVRVFSLAEENLEVDAFSFWRNGRPFIFLNTMKSAERSRMDAAHELGHLVLHWRAEVRGRRAEDEARAFGSAFLMPPGSVLAGVPKGARLEQIIKAKRKWGVAAAALTFRMHKLALLTHWQYRLLFGQLSASGYRADEPDGMQREGSQVLGKVFAALRQDGLTMADVARQLAIPLGDLLSMLFGLTFAPVGATANDQPMRVRSARPAQLRLVL